MTPTELFYKGLAINVIKAYHHPITDDYNENGDSIVFALHFANSMLYKENEITKCISVLKDSGATDEACLSFMMFYYFSDAHDIDDSEANYLAKVFEKFDNNERLSAEEYDSLIEAKVINREGEVISKDLTPYLKDYYVASC